MKLDETGWNWMKLDETGWNWMKLDETGWNWMKLVICIYVSFLFRETNGFGDPQCWDSHSCRCQNGLTAIIGSWSVDDSQSACLCSEMKPNILVYLKTIKEADSCWFSIAIRQLSRDIIGASLSPSVSTGPCPGRQKQLCANCRCSCHTRQMRAKCASGRMRTAP